MSDQTYIGENIGDIYVGGNIERFEATVFTGETIKPGYGIYVNATRRAYAAKDTDGKFSGVACLMPGKALDVAFVSTATLEDIIEYYGRGQGTIVWVVIEATSPAGTLVDGDPASVGTEDGKFRKFLYVNATEATDSPNYQVGHFVIDTYTIATSLTLDRLIKMVLD